MGARQIIAAGVMVLFCAFGFGCASHRINVPPAVDDLDQPTVHFQGLTQEQRDFADALAHFSEAVRFELNDRHQAALTNYIAAARLDPANDALQFRVALSLLQEKRLNEAIDIMEKAAKARPNSERTLNWLALIYRSADQDDKALATYKRTMAVAPTSSIAFIESAALLSKKGDNDTAIRLLENATQISSNEQPAICRTLGELYLRDATEAANAGKRSAHLTTARKRFEIATKESPDDQTILLILGNIRALDNDIAGAIACYNVLEKKNPDDLGIKEKLAISLMAAGNKTGAVAALEGIAAKQPANGKVSYYLAELYEQLGETNKAIRNYTLAGRASPDDPLPFLKASMLSAASGRYADAESVLRKGLEGAPGQPRLQEMLAYILMDQKKYDECLTQFAKAAAQLPTPAGAALTPNFRLNYSIALQLGGKPEDASAMLIEAARTNSAVIDAYASYMMRDGTSSNLISAIDVLDRFEKKSPAEPRSPMYRGLLLSSLDRHTNAVAAFERAEKLAATAAEPSKILTASFWFWYAAACERIDNRTRAAALFLKSLALNPDNAEARNYLAYMWAEHGEHLDDALQQIRKALQSEPDNPAFIDTLGWIHFQKGDTETALVETQKSLKTVPDDSTINQHMGDILDRLGRKNEAVAFWKKAYIGGSDDKDLPAKLKAAGIDPQPFEAEAAEHRAKKNAPKK